MTTQPMNTLPDLEMLQEMNDLSMTRLYRAEIHHLLKVEGEARKPLYERARQGDQKAREILLCHCLENLLVKAYLIYDERRPAHIDVMDLVGEANVFMLEHMDIALAKREPISYLIAMAVNHIERYCIYCAPMVQRPFGANNEVLSNRQQYTSVESLDASVAGDDELLLIDRVQAPNPPVETEDLFNARFSPLYKAIEQLSPVAQATIIQFYGLFDQPSSTAIELGKQWHVRTDTINANKRTGYRQLKKLLSNDLEQMLGNKPGKGE